MTIGVFSCILLINSVATICTAVEGRLVFLGRTWQTVMPASQGIDAAISCGLLRIPVRQLAFEITFEANMRQVCTNLPSGFILWTI